MSEQNEPNWGPMCEFHDLREDVAELQAALRKLVEVAKWKEFDQELEDEDGYMEYCSVCDKATHEDYPQTCTYAAAIAEAERLLGDGT